MHYFITKRHSIIDGLCAEHIGHFQNDTYILYNVKTIGYVVFYGAGVFHKHLLLSIYYAES